MLNTFESSHSESSVCLCFSLPPSLQLLSGSTDVGAVSTCVVTVTKDSVCGELGGQKSETFLGVGEVQLEKLQTEISLVGLYLEKGFLW